MTEKTMGQILWDAANKHAAGDEKLNLLEHFTLPSFEAAAQAVIAEHEARKWLPIEAAPSNSYVYVLRMNENRVPFAAIDILENGIWKHADMFDMTTHYQEHPSLPK